METVRVEASAGVDRLRRAEVVGDPQQDFGRGDHRHTCPQLEDVPQAVQLPCHGGRGALAVRPAVAKDGRVRLVGAAVATAHPVGARVVRDGHQEGLCVVEEGVRVQYGELGPARVAFRPSAHALCPPR